MTVHFSSDIARLAAAALDKLNETRVKLAKARAAMQWRSIESVHDGGENVMVLAATDDGRVMIWRVGNLTTAMAPNTPDHLRFPATRWMPLPAEPK